MRLLIEKHNGWSFESVRTLVLRFSTNDFCLPVLGSRAVAIGPLAGPALLIGLLHRDTHYPPLVCVNFPECPDSEPIRISQVHAKRSKRLNLNLPQTTASNLGAIKVDVIVSPTRCAAFCPADILSIQHAADLNYLEHRQRNAYLGHKFRNCKLCRHLPSSKSQSQSSLPNRTATFPTQVAFTSTLHRIRRWKDIATLTVMDSSTIIPSCQPIRYLCK